MLKHIVMWRFQDHAEGQTKQQNMDMMKERLLALPAKIDFIRSMQVEQDILHSEKSFDMALVTEFDTKEAMLLYRDNPDHVKVSSLMAKLVSERVVIDYEF